MCGKYYEIELDGTVKARNLKIKDEIEGRRLEVTGKGTVMHGRAKVERPMTGEESGIEMHSKNKTFLITVSDTGQLILTEIVDEV